MIDLSKVKSIMVEVEALIAELDGREYDDQKAWDTAKDGRPGRASREERAKIAKQLQLLAVHFEMAAALARNEYWFGKGEVDPLNRRRER